MIVYDPNSARTCSGCSWLELHVKWPGEWRLQQALFQRASNPKSIESAAPRLAPANVDIHAIWTSSTFQILVSACRLCHLSNYFRRSLCQRNQSPDFDPLAWCTASHKLVCTLKLPAEWLNAIQGIFPQAVPRSYQDSRLMSATAFARSVEEFECICHSCPNSHSPWHQYIQKPPKPSKESIDCWQILAILCVLSFRCCDTLWINMIIYFTFGGIDSLDSQSLKWKRSFLELRLHFASGGIGPRRLTICSFCMLAMAKKAPGEQQTKQCCLQLLQSSAGTQDASQPKI